MSSTVMLEILGLIIGREALEYFSDTFRNKSTAGRLISSAHGLFVLALLHQNNWKDAIEATALYFFFDILFTVKYLSMTEVCTLRTSSIIFHHILGCLLCCFSTVTKSYHEFHPGSRVTRALLMLEICNPLLHFSMILKNEGALEIKNIEYTVQSGDNLGTIARKNNVAISDLKMWNNLEDDSIQLGDKLIVSKKLIIDNSQSVTERTTKKDKVSKSEVEDHYYVKKGDSLFSIAKKYPGVSVSDIKKWNGINGNSLKPGMKLKINQKKLK